MNLAKWNSLTQAQRDLLMRNVIAAEAVNDHWKVLNDNDTKRQAQAGIQVITFDAATSKQYVNKAYAVAWEALTKVSPQYAPQMRMLFSK